MTPVVASGFWGRLEAEGVLGAFGLRRCVVSLRFYDHRLLWQIAGHVDGDGSDITTDAEGF